MSADAIGHVGKDEDERDLPRQPSMRYSAARSFVYTRCLKGEAIAPVQGAVGVGRYQKPVWLA
jgi:hypothetical protein